MTNDEVRPRLTLPPQLIDRLLEVTAILLLVAFVVAAAVGFSTLPDRVPSHFGASGTPDAWSSRTSTIVLPLVAVVMYAVLTALARVPHAFNYPWAITPANAEPQYRLARRLLVVLKNLLVLLFFAVYAGIWATATGTRNGLPAWFLIVGLASLGGAIAVYLVVAARER